MRAKGVTVVAGVACAILLLLWLTNGLPTDRHQPQVPSGVGESSEDPASIMEKGTGAHISADSPEPGGRTELHPEVVVHLLDALDAPVDGRVLLLERTPSLIQRLSSGRWGANYLYEGALWEESLTKAGSTRIVLPEDVAQRDLFLLALAPGYAPLVQGVVAGVELQELQLSAVDAIRLRVVDYEGKSVVGAACRLSPMYLSWEDGPDSFEERLSLRAFIQDSTTDSNGEVLYPICYPGAGNSIQVEPGNPLAIGSKSYCSPGEEVLIQCSAAFSVEGRFLDAETLEPIPNVAVIYAKDSIEGTSTVKTGMTDQLGVFSEEALPFDVPALSVIASLDGFAFERQRIVSPVAGKRFELDFHLHKAHDLTLRLSTTWGEPLADSQVKLRRGRHDFETSFHPTDEHGVVRIPAVLEKEAAYEVLIHVGESFWALPDAVVHAGQETLEVQGLARIKHVELKTTVGDSFMPFRFDWTSMAAEHQGVVQWPAGEMSPLLPAGSGTLGAVGQDGRRMEVQASVPEGVHESIEFLCASSTLQFTWTGASDAVFSLRSSDAWDWHILEEPLSTGTHSLQLWTGRFHMIVEWEGGSLELPSIRIGVDGGDLGNLGWQDSSGIQGMVVDRNGKPLEGVDVSLFSMEQGLGNYAYTEADGFFSIGGLAPGAYMLTASGGTHWGGQYPEENREVFLAPGQVLGGLEITLEIRQDHLLRGNLSEIPPAGTSAFSIENGRMQDVDLFPPMDFRLPVPLSKAFIGAGQLRQGSIFLVMEEVEAGATAVKLPAATRSRTLNLNDEQGHPWVDVRVHVFVGGSPLDFHALPDAQGKIQLNLSPRSQGNLQLRFPDGRVQVLSLEEALSIGTLVVPRQVEETVIAVVNENHQPIPGAVAMQYGIGSVYRAGGDGLLHLPAAGPDTPFLVSAAGHLGVWDWGDQAHEVVLPQLLSGIVLDLSAAQGGEGTIAHSEEVRIRILDLPENALDLGALSFELGAGNLALPPLPGGEWILRFYSGAGEGFGETSISVNQSGQVLRIQD